MRKLIFAINLTLDGCCDHTKGNGTQEVHEYHTNLLRDVDTLVYGRKTYELMVPYWHDVAKDHSARTGSVDEFARTFDAIDKMIVFSRSLEKAEGKNTRIVRGNLQDEVLRLKNEPGKNIATGGVDIPSQLMQLDLIDEYHFVVQPTVVGQGRRLLEGVSLQLQLKLVESKIFSSGLVALRYLKIKGDDLPYH